MSIEWGSSTWGDAAHHDVIHVAANGSYDGGQPRDKGEGAGDE